MYGSPLSQIMQISDLVQMGWTRLEVSKLSENIFWQKLLKGSQNRDAWINTFFNFSNILLSLTGCFKNIT